MKRRRKSVPIMLFWSKSEQRRFIDATEKLERLINDMETLLSKPKRIKAASTNPNGEKPCV